VQCVGFVKGVESRKSKTKRGNDANKQQKDNEEWTSQQPTV
jgi:hypothetical protein